MACVTLKRPLEVMGSPHMETSPKRRCGIPLISSTPPSRTSFKKRKRMLETENKPAPVSTPSSPFIASTPSVANIESEIRRLHGRKLFTESHQNVSASSSSSSIASKDQPLFTMKQVTMICQRMLKEREETLKAEYDKILSAKLLEQYDAFVKFSHDQVERRFAESAFSYVS
ncbi:PREDICTED: akirin-2-like isoform X1 [Amphimedon queenslandica]|uniref:Akirin n=1 Tax=Amphimedon queenslandica TaxID=400682 RepID=A0AAN0IL13_AMPQE|nr:PREDICTED: akirin-2-like isoform X1 [Amphimedon queenslandica]|eukprot:XP_011403540.1 PREDICTED: akirin-2-like isoform X1 [Amphimedon queenslandica]